MNRYDSLAEQVAEDFRVTMLAISQVQKGVENTYRTIQTILQEGRTTDARLTALENWQRTVQAQIG